MFENCAWGGCTNAALKESKFCRYHWETAMGEYQATVAAKATDKPDDNWKHRSLGMKCATCMWWVEKAGDNPSKLGRCRKRAPTMAGFPATYPTDWCGDHKLDEAKA